jgi:hypothetical protein
MGAAEDTQKGRKFISVEITENSTGESVAEALESFPNGQDGEKSVDGSGFSLSLASGQRCASEAVLAHSRKASSYFIDTGLCEFSKQTR